MIQSRTTLYKSNQEHHSAADYSIALKHPETMSNNDWKNLDLKKIQEGAKEDLKEFLNDTFNSDTDKLVQIEIYLDTLDKVMKHLDSSGDPVQNDQFESNTSFLRQHLSQMQSNTDKVFKVKNRLRELRMRHCA